MTPPIVLIHGGLWEPMTAERFWVRPGVVGGLEARGYDVSAPDRRTNARTWDEEVDHLRPLLPAAPVLLVGGSNGCSVALRMALSGVAVAGVVLAWPATAGVDDGMPDGAAALLPGGVLRGVTDAEIAGTTVPTALVASTPPNRVHQRRTVDDLFRLVP